MTGGTEGLDAAVASIESLDKLLGELQDTRDALTSSLEQAAWKYYQGDRPVTRPRLNCTGCRFVYAGRESDSPLIAFTLDCRWCGPDSNAVMRVTAEELAKELEKQ